MLPQAKSTCRRVGTKQAPIAAVPPPKAKIWARTSKTHGNVEHAGLLVPLQRHSNHNIRRPNDPATLDYPSTHGTAAHSIATTAS